MARGSTIIDAIINLKKVSDSGSEILVNSFEAINDPAIKKVAKNTKKWFSNRFLSYFIIILIIYLISISNNAPLLFTSAGSIFMSWSLATCRNTLILSLLSISRFIEATKNSTGKLAFK